jgi:DNA repair protein RadC
MKSGIGYSGKSLKMLCWTLRDNPDADKFMVRDAVTTPDDMKKYASIFQVPREIFVVFVLSASNRVVTYEIVSTGTLNSSLVHPREVFRTAIVGNAASIIIAHNHPSGNPDPSPEDIAITKKVVEAGKIIGIEVRDHIIFADDKTTSFAELGLL